MMKTALITLALLSVSCGKIETSGVSGLGGVRALAPQTISTSDNLIFDSICQALTTKSAKLQTTLPNALNFDVIEKDCNGSTVTFAAQQVRVESTVNAGYQFRRQDTNGLFVFPSVETSDFGFMKEICAGASSLPYGRGATEAVWVSTGGFSTADCPDAPNEQCLLVEYGTKQGTTDAYLIHTVEHVRFNLLNTSGKYGYFTHRKSYATNNCDLGKNTESQASLR